MVTENIDSQSTDLVPLSAAEDIKGLILTVRGKQVLLDSDVARLYGYEKRIINQTAKRNETRFPERYRFQLTIVEYQELPSISQSVILNKGRGQNIKKLPFAYTEQGISMLAGLLRNPIAVKVSLGIIDAFVEMRQFLGANRDVFAKLVSIDNRLLEHDHKFDEVFDLLQPPTTTKQSIFYKGQFYDAFKLITDLIKKAQRRLVIIDNYADDSVLDILTNKHDSVTVAIITGNPQKLNKLPLEKFSAQFGAVNIIKSKDFHDRFIIIDDVEVYTFGASLKDLGSKCFAVFKNEDTKRFVAYVNNLFD
jgi:hypothetical protein